MYLKDGVIQNILEWWAICQHKSLQDTHEVCAGSLPQPTLLENGGIWIS